jgi:hypothetical protein
MRAHRSALAIPMTSLAFVVFILIAWVTCGIAAAGSWNAAMYENFHNCGRQGAEDQSHFLIKGIVGGPAALILALLDSDFARSGWSLSTHACAESARPDAFGIPQELLERSH